MIVSTQVISMMAEGGMIVDNLVVDGNIHRAPVSGKKGKPGWYVATEINGKIFGAYGDWSTSKTYKFSENEKGPCKLTKEEIAVNKMMAEKARKAREVMQEQAVKDSLKIWKAAESVPEDHPYVVNKQIKPYGARFEKKTGALLVNLIDAKGNHQTLQKIWDPSQLKSKDAPSKKIFFKTTYTNSCHVIDGSNNNIYICEGFATGASIHQATHCRVLVAINASNLINVAKLARGMFGSGQEPANIIIAADNDYKKEKNVGLDKAREAAEAIGAELVYPEGIEGTDFNDMAAEKGMVAVRQFFDKEKSLFLDSIQAASSIKTRPVKWLWKPILAKRKFHLLAARGGSAKTTLACDIAARISTGAAHPTTLLHAECFKKGSVLFVTTEDEPDDTLLPRFLAAGGNPDKLFFMSSSNYHLDINKRPRELETIIKRLPDDLALIILDPVTSMTGDANTHVDSNVKRIAGVLSGLAIKHNLAILGIIHFRKGDPTARGNSLVDMVTGSAGWVNSARIALACFMDDKENIGYFGVIKSNIGPKNCTLEYQVVINADEVVEIAYLETKDVNIETVIYKITNRDNGEDKTKIRLDRAMNRYGEFFTEHGLQPAIMNSVRSYIRETLGERITDNELREVERKGGYKRNPGGKGTAWVLHPPACECEKCNL